MQWMVPFHAVSAANWIGVYAQRYMHDYGLTREQLAQIPLNQRRHAALYDKAIFRDPLTIDDYLNARMVSYPLGLFDCDIPCDGSCAVIVSRADAAPDLKQVVRIEAIGSALTGRNTWDQRDDLTETAAHDCAPMMWARTDLTIDDVDTRPALRRLLVPHDHVARGARPVPEGRGRAVARGGREPHRARRRDPAEHQRRPALRWPPARLRLPVRGVRAAARRGHRSPGRGRRGRRGRRRRRPARRLHVAHEGPLTWPPPRRRRRSRPGRTLPGVPAPQLPAVRGRAARVDRRHLAAERRPRLARPRADRQRLQRSGW